MESAPSSSVSQPSEPRASDSTRVVRAELETVDCPLCGASEFTLVRAVRDLMYGTREEFAIVRCNECRHVYVNPRPTAEGILSYYPDDYAPHHNISAAAPSAGGKEPKTSPWYLSSLVRSVPGLRRAYYWLTDSGDVLLPKHPERQRPSPRVLELGCSDGDYLLKLQERGWEAVGIEPASRPAAHAQSRGLCVHCGVLDAGLFPEAHFDAVCAWHVLEHLHDPRRVLEEIARIIKPGGELLLSLPNYGCWEPHVFGRYWYLNQPPIHLHHFTPRTLRSLLESTGFDVVICDHQRNLSNLVGSVALWMRERGWFPNLAERLYRYPDAPTLTGQLVLALPARILATCRQGGRLTVRARRRTSLGG